MALKNWELNELVKYETWNRFAYAKDPAFIKILYRNKQKILDELAILAKIQKERPDLFEIIFKQETDIEFEKYQVSLEKLPNWLTPDIIELAGTFMLEIKEVKPGKIDTRRFNRLINKAEQNINPKNIKK